MIQQTEKQNKNGGMNYVWEQENNLNGIGFDVGPVRQRCER
jgi:hypothetical protein